MLGQFDELVAPEGFAWKIKDILPGVLSAGEDAGVLTEEGAKKLDVSGKLQAGQEFALRKVMPEQEWWQQIVLR